jgi:hypothetical protein
VFWSLLRVMFSSLAQGDFAAESVQRRGIFDRDKKRWLYPYDAEGGKDEGEGEIGSVAKGESWKQKIGRRLERGRLQTEEVTPSGESSESSRVDREEEKRKIRDLRLTVVPSVHGRNDLNEDYEM